MHLWHPSIAERNRLKESLSTAVIDRAPPPATISAATELERDALALADLPALDETPPQLKIKMLENLAPTLSRKLRQANRALTVLE